ncbi:MAG TPA: hypothetical protein DEG71_05115 [Clostridiales bacterium]|nr:hypothetical protein [Clostridiales bacterium]
MKGQISIQSEVGTGSVFTLHIPNIIGQNVDTDQNVLTCDNNTKNQYSISETDFKPKSDKAILIIINQLNFANNVKKINKALGIDTIHKMSGKQGLEFLKKYNVDGILLSLALPDMSGIEVLREIKSTKELKNIPVHIISSLEGENLNAESLNFQKVVEDEIACLVSEMIAPSGKSVKKLLIIEDDKIQREAIAELVATNEINVHGVSSEEEAKTELRKKIYDAVILDLGLSDGNGLNVCKFIGKLKLNIPVIVYTGRDLTLEQEKEIIKYADSIIIKTANSDQRLLDEITLFLHKVKRNEKTERYLKPKTNKEQVLSLKDKKILIVDDDPRNVFVLASALEEYGAEILEAENGKVALEKLDKEKTDLILMDIMMPVMDGFETIKAIRSKKELTNIPIIALTAKTLKGDKEKCIKAGANDYISKPVEYDALIRLVKAWISK